MRPVPSGRAGRRRRAPIGPDRWLSGNSRRCSTGALKRYYPTMARAALADTISTPDGKRRYLRALFATIADRYDFITVALSYGQDARWKRRLVAIANPTSRTRVLDLATGTGDLAFESASRGATVVGLDITQRMIELAREKANASPRFHVAPQFLVGDMLALPFPDASFDIVTTGYGLRNVPNLTRAIDEIRRVLT